MICIIAGNYDEARRWARSQYLDDSEWFFPHDIDDLNSKQNFHVMVVGTAGQNVPPAYFEKVWQLARVRGRMNRK